MMLPDVDSRLTSKSRFKRPETGTVPLFLQRPFLNASVVNGSFRKFVGRPRHVDENEWLASNGTYA
jgi:hypothetical protein